MILETICMKTLDGVEVEKMKPYCANVSWRYCFWCCQSYILIYTSGARVACSSRVWLKRVVCNLHYLSFVLWRPILLSLHTHHDKEFQQWPQQRKLPSSRNASMPCSSKYRKARYLPTQPCPELWIRRRGLLAEPVETTHLRQKYLVTAVSLLVEWVCTISNQETCPSIMLC